jgi:hypothetical protein
MEKKKGIKITSLYKFVFEKMEDVTDVEINLR